MQRATALASGVGNGDEFKVIGGDDNDTAGTYNAASSTPEDDDDNDGKYSDSDDETRDGDNNDSNSHGDNDNDDGASHNDHDSIESVLRLPRRPSWTRDMSASQLDSQEQAAFLDWRRNLASIEERCSGRSRETTLTPFEKNLQVWRQLWRVLERSDLVVQIVDARDPLMYRCEDLEDYVIELATKGRRGKRNFLLLNKADMLPLKVRRLWVDYLKEQEGVSFAFWSAKQANEKKMETFIDSDGESDRPPQPPPSLEEMKRDIACFEPERVLDRDELLMVLQVEAARAVEEEEEEEQAIRNSEESNKSSGGRVVVESKARLVVGLVGYPNVGKSSTINTLVGSKKTMVSATPGKTKHFQTLIISDELMLCDCPGLVFPAIGRSKAEMVASGVLPVDRLTDVRSPVGVIAARVPRQQLERVYNILLPKPKLHEPQNRPPTGAELIISFALCRGIVAGYGAPDQTRAGRLIIKDYINGKLLHCTMPPHATREAIAEIELELGGGLPAAATATTCTSATHTEGDSHDDASTAKAIAERNNNARRSGMMIDEDRSAGIVHASATNTVTLKNTNSQEYENHGRRKSHKFHKKGSRRNQPKSKANGYGYYDPYE